MAAGIIACNDVTEPALCREAAQPIPGGGTMAIQQITSRRTALVLGAAASLSLSLTRTSEAQAPELESPKAKQVQALVDKAAQLVGSEGRAAFPKFRQKGSEWFTGDTYVFIMDMKANQLFNAAFPKLEGTNTWDLQDKNGKYINRAFIQMLAKQDAGWVDYMWPKPSTGQVAHKWTYMKRVDIQGTPAGLGAGFYPD